MAYTLSNKCAKNVCKRTVQLQLIIKNVVTCFIGTQYMYISVSVNATRVRALVSINQRSHLSGIHHHNLLGPQLSDTILSSSARFHAELKPR